MIRTMYQFGQHLREVEDMKPYFEIAAAPYPEKATDDLVIIADIKDRQFQRLTLEPYKKTLVPKYLFRELAAARATSIVPTLHFFFAGNDKALDDSCTKFLDKLARCVENNKSIYEKHFEILSLMEGMQNNLKAVLCKAQGAGRPITFPAQHNQRRARKGHQSADHMARGQMLIGKKAGKEHDEQRPEIGDQPGFCGGGNAKGSEV